jgi:hypothetical protein
VLSVILQITNLAEYVRNVLLATGRITAASLVASLSQMGATDVLSHVPDMIAYADPDQDGQVSEHRGWWGRGGRSEGVQDSRYVLFCSMYDLATALLL